MARKRFFFHYHCLIVHRISSSIYILGILSFVFFLIGIYQGFMDSTLHSLLSGAIIISLISFSIYGYGLIMTGILLIQNRQKNLWRLGRRNIGGFLGSFVLSFGGMVLQSFLS